MKQSVSVFSPGEVIFFGEHSVVYGKTADACALDRGVRVEAVSDSKPRIRIRSHFPGYTAEFRIGETGGENNPLLYPVAELIRFELASLGSPPGALFEIQSEIPMQAGLASSAAVSAAALLAVHVLAGNELGPQELLAKTFKGEIGIQKRGSRIGSFCTTSGGFVSVRGHEAMRKEPFETKGVDILIFNSEEPCPTSESTAIVRQKMEGAPEETARRFEEMDQLAQSGIAAIARADWKETGFLMSKNQEHLVQLGVSTERIDRFLSSIASELWGGKITGAGGGGCVLLLPKPGSTEVIRAAAKKQGLTEVRADLSSLGTRVEEVPCEH